MNKMNKKILSLAVMLPMFLCSFAQDDVTKEKFTPFYQMADAPHMEKVLPAPPALTDSRFFYDWTQYQWGKSIRETERGKQAIADAEGKAKDIQEKAVRDTPALLTISVIVILLKSISFIRYIRAIDRHSFVSLFDSSLLRRSISLFSSSVLYSFLLSIYKILSKCFDFTVL